MLNQEVLNKEQQNGGFQKIKCSELHNTMFNELVLKDEAIQNLLENLEMIFNKNKFYQTSFKSALSKLNKLNVIRQQRPLKFSSVPSQIVIEPKNKPEKTLMQNSKITLGTDSKSQKTTMYSHIQDTSHFLITRDLNFTEQTHDWSDIYVSPKEEQTKKQAAVIQEKQPTNSSKKLKKKNKKAEIETFPQIDEVKEFEKRMELEFETSKFQEKIIIEYRPQWVAKLQSKFVQALKNLHYS